MSISRRTALATGAAAITTAAIAAPIATKAAGVKAALAGDPVVALAAQVKAAYRAHVEAYDAYEDVAHDAGHSICADFATTCVTTIEGRVYSLSRDAVLLAATPDGHLFERITPEERDRALTVIDAHERKVARIRHDLGLDPIKSHKEQCTAHWRDLEAQMLDTSALTIAGVLAKMQSWYCDDEIEAMRNGGEPELEMPTDLVASIYCDLEHLAGGLPS